MGKRILIGILCSIPGYFAGLFLCLWLLPYVTSNHHDVSVEAAMTGAFVAGPGGALVSFVIGAVLGSSAMTKSVSDRKKSGPSLPESLR